LIGLEADFRERDAKIGVMKSQIASLTREFENNWLLLGLADRRIEELCGELEGLAGKQEAGQVQIEFHHVEFEKRNARLTSLEEREVQICSRVHDLRNQINYYTAVFKKLEKSRLSECPLAIEQNVAKLKEQLESRRKNLEETQFIVNQIHQEGVVEIEKTEREIENSKSEFLTKLEALKTKQTSLRTSVQNVEKEFDDCMKRLNLECQHIETEAHSSNSIPLISKLQSEIEQLDEEIEHLANEIKNEHKNDIEKREIIEKVNRILGDRLESSESDIIEVKRLLDADELKISNTRSRLDDKLSQNAYLEAAIDSSLKEFADQPDHCRILRAEIEEFQKALREKWCTESAKWKAVKEKKKRACWKLRQIGAQCDALVLDLQAIADGIGKMVVVQKKRKRNCEKRAALSRELMRQREIYEQAEIAEKEYENELEKLRQSRRAVGCAISEVQGAIRRMDERQRVEEERLERENEEMREGLIHYEKIKRFYLRRIKGKEAVMGNQGGRMRTKFVLQCNKLDIQAT
jgi:chromosome segregation ATPase